MSNLDEKTLEMLADISNKVLVEIPNHIEDDAINLDTSKKWTMDNFSVPDARLDLLVENICFMLQEASQRHNICVKDLAKEFVVFNEKQAGGTDA